MHRAIFSRNLPGTLDATSPQDIDLSRYDLVVQKKTLESQVPTAKTSGATGYARRPSANSGSAAFRTLHDHVPFGRAHDPAPFSAAPLQEHFENGKFISHRDRDLRSIYKGSHGKTPTRCSVGMPSHCVGDGDQPRSATGWPSMWRGPGWAQSLGRGFYRVTLLRDDEPTNWLGWPRLLPRSIQDQRQASQECEAIRHEFRRASVKRDRPSPAIPANARSP